MCLNLVPRINLYIHIYHDVMIMMAFVIYLSSQNALSVHVFNLFHLVVWKHCLLSSFMYLGMSGSEFSEIQVLITA
jgi:hypothetical protein